MSFYEKGTLNRYNGLIDTYLDYSWIALSNPNPVKIEQGYGYDCQTPYIRTYKMLFNEILQELYKSYSSPDRAITYRRNRRFMFV